MTKSSKKLLAIILSIVMVLACAVTLGLALTPKAEVKADATDYRGKVVIWDYYAANVELGTETDRPNHYVWANTETPSGTGSNGASAKYIVLKNVSNEDIDISAWKMYYISDAGKASILNNAENSKVTFKAGTIIPANGYLFYSFGVLSKTKSGVTTKSTYPDFIMNKTIPVQSTSSTGIGAKGSILITTQALSSITGLEITSLSSEMVDLIGGTNGTTTCPCYLGGRVRINSGTHLLRNDNYTKPGYVPNNTNDYDEETNYWNSELDNSLSYLAGSTDTYVSIATAKAETDPEQDVTIKATITHYDSAYHRYTMQDNTGAMLVTVPSTTPELSVGRVVLATGNVTSGSMTVESEENFVGKGSNSVNYASPTLAQILAADSMYDNYCVELKNMSYDSDNHTIGDGTNTLKIDENGVTVSGTTISVKGIVRIVESVKTLVLQSATEYRVFAYGEINQIRALDQTEYAGINFSAQGFISYSKGTFAYLEDNGAGIQLYGTALGTNLHAGDYVIIDGVINTRNNNTEIKDVTLIEIIDNPVPTRPEPNPLTNSSEISTYMHRSVSITNAVVTAKPADGKPYQIRFGEGNSQLAYLDVDSLSLDLTDEIRIVRGVVFNGNSNTLTIRCGEGTNFIIVKSNSIQEIIENGTDGQDVLTKGVVTYVDNANSLFVLQYNGYGIVVKVNGGTNREITEISASQSYKVAGTLTKNATETYITATTLNTRSGSAEDPTGTTLADYATHNLQYVIMGTKANPTPVKVSAVVDAHTYTITDGTNTATLITAYEKGLHLYDYITVKAVVYNGNLVTSDEADVVNLMTSTKDFYSLPNDYSKPVYMRGTVTYIEIDIHNSQEGIENFIIQSEVDGVNYATRVYVGNTLLAKDALKLGDVVTVIGDFDYDNSGSNPTQRRQIRRDSSNELISDIVHGTPIEAEVFNISQITRNANDARLNGRYVKLEGVTLDEIIVDNNDSIVAILSKNNKQIKLYFSKNNAKSDIDGGIIITLDIIKNIFYQADIYEGDTFDIIGNFNYYKPKNTTSSIDGIRLELNLGGLKSDGQSFDTVFSKSTTDYISNQVKTEYTLTYINGQNVVVRQETLRRNANFRTLDVINVPGKVFIGWYDSGVKYNANTNYAMPTHDLTLRATYTDKTYTVKFVTGTEEVINDITGLEYNMRIALPNPAITKANCTFGGWYMDENYSKAFTANTTITEDTTLYARWREKSTPADGGKSQGGADTTLVVIISVASTLVVVGGGILVVYFIKNKKKK